MRVNTDQDNDAALEIAPLIDIVFLLLIFFLVATVMKKPEEELKVELPPPAITAGLAADRDTLKLGIDAEGVLYIGATAHGQASIHDQLRQVAAENPHRHIRLEVDRNAPAGRLVQLLDLMAYEGLRNYGIHTQERR